MTESTSAAPTQSAVPQALLPLLAGRQIVLADKKKGPQELPVPEAVARARTAAQQEEVLEAVMRLLSASMRSKKLRSRMAQIPLAQSADPLVFHGMDLDAATCRGLTEMGVVEAMRNGRATLADLLRVPGIGVKSFVAIVTHLERAGLIPGLAASEAAEPAQAAPSLGNPILDDLHRMVTIRAGSVRGADIYFLLKGFVTGKPQSTRAAGRAFGLSHESANVIRSRVEQPASGCLHELTDYPQIAAFIRAARMEKAGRVHELASRVGFRVPEALACVLEFLCAHVGVPGIKLTTWGEHRVFLALEDYAFVYSLVLDSAKARAKDSDCATFAQVLADVHRNSPDSIDPRLVQVAIECIPGAKWFDEEKDLFIFGSHVDRRLTAAVDLVCEAYGVVALTDLARGLARDERLMGIARSPRLEAILQSLGYRVRNGRVRPRMGATVTGPKATDLRMLRVLLQEGGQPIEVRVFAERCLRKKKIADKVFYHTLSKSPLFREVEGKYCAPLVGA